jgi:probable rRNA maturation factor
VTRAIYLGPWRVDLSVRDGVSAPLPAIALVRCMASALVAGGATTPASIGLILSDDIELARLNAGHLGKADPTDVLSFPLLAPEAFPPHAGARRVGGEPATRSPAFALPPGRRPHLGDIVISVERAIAQAGTGRGGQTGTVRWSAADELRLLAVHGTLHVCGWDHAEPDEEAAMRALEGRLLGESSGSGGRRSIH